MQSTHVASVRPWRGHAAVTAPWVTHAKARKHAGFVGVLFLTLLSVLLYLTNKRIWRPIKHKDA